MDLDNDQSMTTEATRWKVCWDMDIIQWVDPSWSKPNSPDWLELGTANEIKKPSIWRLKINNRQIEKGSHNLKGSLYNCEFISFFFLWPSFDQMAGWIVELHSGCSS